MKIKLVPLLVENQEKALKFYTDILGFIKKREIPIGEYKWLTLVSQEEQTGAELQLAPLGFEPSRTYQKALFDAGIPANAFKVENIQMEYERLLELGVVFSMKPTRTGPTTIAVFDDTCGNHIQLFEV